MEDSFCVVVSGSFLQRVLTDEVRPEPARKAIALQVSEVFASLTTPTLVHGERQLGLAVVVIVRTGDVELQEAGHSNARGKHEAPAGSGAASLGHLR